MKLLEKKDSNCGFIFEVDLDYPESLWDLHNDYPLAPEKVRVDKIEKTHLLVPSKKALRTSSQKFEAIPSRRNDPQKSTSRNKALSKTLDGVLYQKKY